MKAKFEGTLRVDVLKKPVGKKWFKSTRPLRYISESGKIYSIPSSVPTDFGTVPRGLRWLVPRIGLYNYATYFHDWLCEDHIVSRKEADRLFLEAQKACGLGWFKRRLRYFGVRSYSIMTFKK